MKPNSNDPKPSQGNSGNHDRNKLGQILGQSPDVIYTLDFKGVFIEVSKACKQVLGYEWTELIGKKFVDIVSENDRIKAEEALARVMVGKEIQNSEIRLIGKGNKIVPFVWSAQSDAEEKLVYAIARDISERKAAEQKIEDTRTLLQSGIESADDMLVFSVDKNYQYLYFNSAHKKVMLRTYEKDIKEGVSILSYITNDDDRVRAKTSIDRALSGENVLIKGEYGGVDRNYYEIRFNPIINEKKEIIGVTGFVVDITEAQRAKEELEKSQERFRSAIERVSDAFVALDSNWCYTYMNKTAGKIFNRDPQAMIGKHIWTEFPEGIGQPFYKAYHQAMAEQKYIQLEEYYSPYRMWFVNYIYPSPDGISIYFRDITKEKEEEQRKRIYEVRMTKAQEIGNLGYWEVEPNSKFIWGSPKALEIFGLPKDVPEVPVKDIEACIEDADKVREAATDLIVKGKKYEVEYWMHPADGSPAKYILSVAEIENDIHGVPRKIMGVIRDITEQKAAEEKLLKAYQKITSILENINDGFITLNTDWRVSYWNKAAERIIGISRENVLNNNLWECCPHTIFTHFYSEFKRSVKENAHLHFEEYFAPADVWFEMNIYPSKDGLSVFFSDISEKKRQEKLDILEKETLELYTSRKSSIDEMLTYLLNGIQKIHPDMICSVLKVRDSKMYNWSTSQLPKSYNAEVEGLPIGIGHGSCGTAAYLREKVEVSDISTHPYWKDYKQIAALYGLKACWSYPIFDSGQNLLGTFGIYYKKRRSPKKGEMLTIDRARIILVNIIENKSAENAIKAYKDQLELIYNNSTDVIFLLAIEAGNRYKFESINIPFLSATGHKREQVEGKYVEEVIPEPSLSLVLTKYKAAIQERQTVFWEETTPYPTGEKTGIVSVSPVFNEHNECVKLLGVVHDITERKKNEETIRRSNEELKHKNADLKEKNMKLEDIAWIQSHKVRAPVARIMGLVNLLTTDYPDKERETGELLNYIVTSANELDGMIKEIIEKADQVKQYE